MMGIGKVRTKVWKVEEIGKYSLILSSAEVEPPGKNELLMPNPTSDFITLYGGHDYLTFRKKFGVESKDNLYTPETLVVYLNSSVPEWVKVGMEVIY